MKIGRNSPCPCESGKKYKRCCMAKDAEAGVATGRPKTGAKAKAKAALDSLPDSPHDLFSDSSSELCTYAKVRMFEESEPGRMLYDFDRDLWKRLTARGVASLSTEEIQLRMADMGIAASRDVFLALTTGRIEAWDIATQWQESECEDPTRDQWFVGLAACELWKRFCPERPSIEMLDDWMQEGYSYDCQGQYAKACDVWWRLWQELRSRFTAAMRTTKQADVTFRGQQILYNWTQDFTLSLHNASHKDPVNAERGIEYLGQLIEQFPEEDDLYLANAGSDLGEMLCRIGRADAGIRVLEETIRDYPEQAVGYCRLADEVTQADPRRALALLEEARDRPVEDAAGWDLGSRIEELRQKLANG